MIATYGLIALVKVKAVSFLYEKRIVSINMLSKDNKKLTDILEEFLLYKKSQGNCCERTEKDYRYHIKKLLEDSEDILIEKSLRSELTRQGISLP